MLACGQPDGRLVHRPRVTSSAVGVTIRLPARGRGHPRRLDHPAGPRSGDPVRYRGRRRCEEISPFALSAETFLQVEEGQPFPVLEGHDLAVENHVVSKISRATLRPSRPRSRPARRSTSPRTIRTAPACRFSSRVSCPRSTASTTTSRTERPGRRRPRARCRRSTPWSSAPRSSW